MSEDPMEQMTEKQRRVVEAALEVFAERGFAGASTSEIAKRAGVAEGTIFRHYKTKKELLIGVVAPFFFRVFGPALMKEVLDVVEAEHESFEDLVRALYQNRLDFVKKHEQRVRVIAQELPFHPEVRALLEQEVVSRVFPRLAAVVRRYQARGEVLDTDPASVVRVIVSTLMSYVVLRFVLAPHRAWDDALEMELNVKLVVDGLRPRAREP